MLTTRQRLKSAELRSPHLPQEGYEIERKFLLSGTPPSVLDSPKLVVKQGWIPGKKLKERLRMTSYEDGSARYFRTVKSGSGLVKIEIEEQTNAELFDYLWPLTVGRRVTKLRYLVQEVGFLWEVDVFTDRELVLAEVELPTPESLAPMPAWILPYMVREVTEDSSYSNSSLAF